MSKAYVEGREFSVVNFAEERLQPGEYEQCVFKNCSFLDSDLAGCSFLDCVFDTCDLSMARLKGASFRDVKFVKCKQLGLRFDECNTMLLSFSFEDCTINFSSFFKLKLKNIRFKGCTLHEVDFTQTDLSQANFDGSDLAGAMFSATILEAADLRGAVNFSIDPEQNKIKKAKFSFNTIAGLLDKYKIIIE